jgi:hypothetical protein
VVFTYKEIEAAGVDRNFLRYFSPAEKKLFTEEDI